VASGKDWVVLQHVAHEEPGAIGEALISAGHVVSVVRVDLGDPVPGPGEVADMAGLVVMGGPMGVDDDEAHPWLAHERDLMAAAVAAESPCWASVSAHSSWRSHSGDRSRPDRSPRSASAKSI
jgi:GMP synthase-like glutamine amidotransferase